MKINNSGKQWAMEELALKATSMPPGGPTISKPEQAINKANYEAMRHLMLLKLCSCRPLFFVVAVVLLANVSLWLPGLH